MIIIIIALKGAIGDFCNLLTAPRTVSSTYAQVARANHMQITCNTSSAYHVQSAVCHLEQRDSSAVKFDRIEIEFILAFFWWLKPLNDEGGEEIGVPGENP